MPILSLAGAGTSVMPPVQSAPKNKRWDKPTIAAAKIVGVHTARESFDLAGEGAHVSIASRDRDAIQHAADQIAKEMPPQISADGCDEQHCSNGDHGPRYPPWPRGV